MKRGTILTSQPKNAQSKDQTEGIKKPKYMPNSKRGGINLSKEDDDVNLKLALLSCKIKAMR